MAKYLKETVSKAFTWIQSKASTWLRGLHFILYAVIFYFIGTAILLIAILQFILKLVTGTANSRLKILGHDLGIYVGSMIAFVTFHSDSKPWPFSPWPGKSPSLSAKKAPSRPKTRSKAPTRRRSSPRRTPPKTQGSATS